MNFSKNLKGRFSPVWLLILFSVCISSLTRLCLLLATVHAGISFAQLVGLFFIGLLYDVGVACVSALVLLAYVWFQNNFIYRKPVTPWMLGAFAVLLGLLAFVSTISTSYSHRIVTILIIYIAVRFIVYGVLVVCPYRFRVTWRRLMLYLFLFVSLYLLLLNATSEWFFWQEFYTRYNFITVDNLIYTNEVSGDISQSYHTGIIFPALAVAACAITYLCCKIVDRSVVAPASFSVRTGRALLLLAAAAATFFIPGKWRHFSKNEYANELAGNGLFEFVNAFKQKGLNFYTAYQTIPDKEAFALLRNELQTANTFFTDSNHFNLERTVYYPQAEQKHNVVLISIESMSGSFMKAFGNTQNLTPYLDSLAQKSLFFTSCYAAGTRTVRGLEALTLSIPPTPGESILKRPHGIDMFSLGSIFKQKGYTTQFLYGGNSNFDNMKTFFGNNGYTVIDRSAIPSKNVHFENVWGVADEDLFTQAIHTMDEDAALQKPFFAHIMTVSNHRPFTYPEGRIDIPAASQTREGCVKYTDWAINRFLKEASTKPWFDNTIFVLVADHCAHSDGRVKLPVTGYHIPLIVFAPKLVQARAFNGITSQIDVAPMLLGLLHFRYNSTFMGQDVLNVPADKQRAFISTYNDLGYLQNGKLVIQEPQKKLSEFVPDFSTGNATATPLTDSVVKKAIAYYQCAGWLLKNNKHNTKYSPSR